MTATALAPVPDQSRAERLSSFAVHDFPSLSGREEDWRFVPLDRIRGLHTGAVAVGPAPRIEVTTAPGARTETVGREDPRLGRTGPPQDRVAAAAWEGFTEAVVVTLSAGSTGDAPTLVTVLGGGGVGYGHLAVLAEAGATGTIVVDHRGSGARADTVEIDVADGAAVTFVSIQDWADDAVHLSAHRIRLGRDASCKHVIVTLGGDVVRVTPSVRFAGPGGQVELYGLYFADAGQFFENRLFVDHSAPNCRSHVVYKGALRGESAHTVWVGDVLIRAEAEGTDTYELNRNLVLSEGARADSVPNLEIETGEIVGASHASATGRFDDEQLFYLQARGIAEDEARRLVVRGFFAELIAQIGVADVQDRLMTSIDRELLASDLALAGAADGAPEGSA